MIIETLISIFIHIFNFVTYTLFAPLRLFLPNVISFDGTVTGIFTFISDTLTNTFNFFAYFSHVSVVRVLIFVTVLNLFTYPLIYVTLAGLKFFISFGGKLKDLFLRWF